jgi:tRNA modification GTPase
MLELTHITDRDTIVACSTPPGFSTRALIRASGPAVHAILQQTILQQTTLQHNTPLTRSLRPACLRLINTNSTTRTPLPTLPILLTTLPGPNSYTGEDSLELLLPGNPTLIERALATLTSLPGTRLAGPGEFTARAFFAGKLTLDQAEGIGATIAAHTESQLDAAHRLLAGELGRHYHAWAEELSSLLALVEAGIDFTDQEDVVAISPTNLLQRLEALRKKILAHLGSERSAEVTASFPTVSLIGVPNAGKSTLFNALLGRRRAIASPVAGTTRDVLAEPLDLARYVPGSGSVTLQDLAGVIQDSHLNPLDEAAQALAINAALHSNILLWCDPTGQFDLHHDSTRIPSSLASILSNPAQNVLRVRTCADLPARDDLADLAVCALDGWHLQELAHRLAALLITTDAPNSAATLFPRHRLALRAALIAINAATSATEHDTLRLSNPELIADALRTSLNAIEELVGRISPDDVLGKVFSTFCVGK